MSDLETLLAKLAKARGTPAEWMARESAMLRFIASVERPTRVFCRGEVHLDKGHFPAVLTYNPIYKQTLAWAPSGRKNAMEGHHESAFFGDGHLVGIARDVLAGPETTALAAAASGGDVKQAPGEAPQSGPNASEGNAQ